METLYIAIVGWTDGKIICVSAHPNNCVIYRAIFGSYIYRFVTCLIMNHKHTLVCAQNLSDGHSGPPPTRQLVLHQPASGYYAAHRYSSPLRSANLCLLTPQRLTSLGSASPYDSPDPTAGPARTRAVWQDATGPQRD
jgi:hypothetical protein